MKLRLIDGCFLRLYSSRWAYSVLLNLLVTNLIYKHIAQHTHGCGKSCATLFHIHTYLRSTLGWWRIRGKRLRTHSSQTLHWLDVSMLYMRNKNGGSNEKCGCQSESVGWNWNWMCDYFFLQFKLWSKFRHTLFFAHSVDKRATQLAYM